MNKSITKLKKKEYDSGANLAIENAENLLEIARVCQEKGHHGNGVSILITSLEELSKAAYLKIKAHNPHVVIRELETFFKDHKIKHETSIRLLIKSITNNLKTLPEDHQTGAAIAIGLGLVVIGYFFAKSEQTIDLEMIRQKGYYVNFVGGENCWQSPQQLITSEVFSDYLDLSEKVFENVRKDLFTGKLSDSHTRQYIEELSDENVYFRKTYQFNS